MGRLRKNTATEDVQVVNDEVEKEVSEDVTDQETADAETQTEVENSDEVEIETSDEVETENADEPETTDETETLEAESEPEKAEPENVEESEYPKTVHLVCPRNFYRNLADTTPKRITGTIVLLEDLGSHYKASRIVPGFGVVVGYLDK